MMLEVKLKVKVIKTDLKNIICLSWSRQHCRRFCWERVASLEATLEEINAHHSALKTEMFQSHSKSIQDRLQRPFQSSGGELHADIDNPFHPLLRWREAVSYRLLQLSKLLSISYNVVSYDRRHSRTILQ